MQDTRPAKDSLSAIIDVAGERQSLTLTFVGLALSLVTYLVGRDVKVPLWSLCLTAIILIAFLYVVIESLRKSLLNSGARLPAIRAVISDNQDPEKPVLLLEPSELFGMFSRVSVYHKAEDTGYEILIAYGAVLTVQSDGKIQIKIEEWLSSNHEIANGIRNQSINFLKNTLVKPSAPAPKHISGLSVNDIDQILKAALTYQNAVTEESADE